MIISRQADKLRDPLTYQVIGEAMHVHTELGPGLDEVFYHQRLAQRLGAVGLDYQSRHRGPLWHRGRLGDEFECDLLVERQAIVELKAPAAEETFAPEHLAQILCYMKYWKCSRGLLLDFGKERLVQRRVVFTERAFTLPDPIELAKSAPAFIADRPIAQAIRCSLVRLLELHGLGYRDTTYRALLAADLAVEGIAISEQPTASIRLGDALLGETKCRCLGVNGQVAVLVLALRHRISTTDRAVLQTYLRHLGMAWGVIANFGQSKFETLFVSAPRTTSEGVRTEMVLPKAHLQSSLNLRGS
jgi:GxxExxY protein